jgi:hypothetical protein
MSEDFVLQLANLPGNKKPNGPRRVATPEGAAFYGQPVGTIITADMIEKAKQAKGSAPKGALAPVKQGSGGGNSSTGSAGASDASQGGAAQGGGASPVGGTVQSNMSGGGVAGNIYTEQGYKAPGIDSTPPDWVTNPPAPPEPPKMALGIKESELNGPKKFVVGESSFSAPEGSRLVRPKSGASMAIIIDPAGEIHFFTEKGEVEADDLIKNVLKERFAKKVKPDDTMYSEEEFDSEDGLENMQVGQNLFDAAGNKIFTKTEKGYVHTDLGIPVEEKDIKPLFDSGELSSKPKKVAEEDITDFDYGDDDENEISFASMSEEEFNGYMETLDPGDKLYFATTSFHTPTAVDGGSEVSKEGPDEYKTIVKLDDGDWFVDGAEKSISVSTLFYIKPKLRTIKPTELQPWGTWSAGEKKKDDEKAAKQAEKDAVASQKAAAAKVIQDQKDAEAEAIQKEKDYAAAQFKAAKDAERAKKKAAEQKVVDQALSENNAIEDAKAQLTPYNKTKLGEQQLGSIPNASFKINALPGSKVLIQDDQSVWEKLDGVTGMWSSDGGKHKLSSVSLFDSSPTLVVKNTFNGDDEWKPANDGTDDSVGSVPSAIFLSNAPKGSIVADQHGDEYFRTSDGRWVRSHSPNNKGTFALSALNTDAMQGDAKIKKVGDAAPDQLVVGDTVDSEEDRSKLYDQAGPGTSLSYYESQLTTTTMYTVTLDDEGVWVSDKAYLGKSYTVPNNDSIKGALYITSITPSEKKLDVGDTPTVEWMEKAEVGATVSINNPNTGYKAYLVKKENKTWDSPEAVADEFGMSPSGLEEFFEKYNYKIEAGVPAAEASAGQSFKAGDVASFDAVLQAPNGTKFKYQKLDGTQSDYSKHDSDMVLAPGGTLLSIEHWKKSLDLGKVTFADDSDQVITPDGSLADKPAFLDPGLPEPLVAPTGDSVEDAAAHDAYVKELEDAEADLDSFDDNYNESSFDPADPGDLTHDELENAPEDTQVVVPQYSSGEDDEEKTTDDETYEIYTKSDDGYWYEAGEETPWTVDELETMAIGGIALYGQVGSVKDPSVWYSDKTDLTLDNLLNAPFGAVVAVPETDGETGDPVVSHYTKGNQGEWMDEDHWSWSSSELVDHALDPIFIPGSTKAGKIGTMPDPSVYNPKDVKYTAAQLDSYPVGTIIGWAKDDAYWTKNESGMWQSPDGSSKYGSSDVASGYSNLHEAVLPEPTIAEVIADVQAKKIAMTMGDTTVYASEEEAWGAIEALENHSHGSPIYGLKSLPNSNSLKANQDYLIYAATQMFPKDKPKAAVLKFLKGNVSVSNNEDDLSAKTDVMIHLGNEKPVKNAFGITGGDFKQSDIEMAVLLLKGYDGKLYKSQLDKFGNPLSVLDFNTLVGKNKDKLEQKQQVIDFLKKQVNDLKPIEKPSLETVVGNDAADPVHSDKPGYVNPQFTADKGAWVETDPFSADDLPEGTKITGDDGQTVYEQGHNGIGKSFFNIEDPEEGWTDADNIEGDYLKVWVPAEDAGLKKLMPSELGALPEGTKIVYTTPNDLHHTLTKDSKGLWRNEANFAFTAAMIETGAENNQVHLLSVPEPVTELNTDVPSFYDLQNYEVGTKVMFNVAIPKTYTKTSEGWESPLGSILHDEAFSAAIDAKMLKLISKPDNTPAQFIAPPATQSKLADWEEELLSGSKPHNLLPGMYISGPDEIQIFADGSAVWTTNGGSPVNKTAEQVAGFKGSLNLENTDEWEYKGIPAAEEAAKVTPKKAVKIKNPAATFNPKQLPDGEYYLGDPSNAATPVWSAKAGVVTQYTDKAEVISPVKVKNAVLKGTLLDKWGNTAVLPKDHIGTVYLLGTPTNTESLKQLRLALEDDQFQVTAAGANSLLSSYGVYAPKLDVFVNSTQGSLSPASYKAALKTSIDGILGSPDDYPFKDLEAEAMGNFAWYAGTGKAQFPTVAAQLFQNDNDWYKMNSEAKTAIDAISKDFGDGETIGQHLNGVNVIQKRLWLKAFLNGDFKGMYDIEVQGAVAKGVSHSAGWKHPGYPDNSMTNKINWGAAVAGEKTVDDVIPGKWTPLGGSLPLPQAEVDNYLIAASMQHPEHLSLQERRFWVAAHRGKNVVRANNLSVKAEQHYLSGAAPLSPTPEWTDDVKPPKSYASLFEGNPYPVDWTGNGGASKAAEFVNDIQAGEVEVKDPEGKKLAYVDFYKFLEEVQKEEPYNSTAWHNREAVTRFFMDLRAQQDAIDSKPVYKLAPTQTVKQSLHPIYNVVDQFGNKFLFKPAADDPAGKKYRANVETWANKIGSFFGTRAPWTETIEFQGQLGSIQKEIDVVGFLSSFSWKNATEIQTIDLVNEHLTDWMLDQDDNWAPNTLIDTTGHLVGVDKGRAFRSYGSWDGMRPDAGMDVNTHLVYSDLYQAIISGEISKEVADKTWIAARNRAYKMSKADDGALLEMLHAATDDRQTWSVDYEIDGKKVPQTQQGFFDAFFDRKAKLPEQVQDLWQKIYTKAGYGELPQPPKAYLGDGQHSGLDDENFHHAAFVVEAAGTSTLVNSPHIDKGYALAWGINNGDGSKDIHTQLHLAPKKQKETLAWFIENTDHSVSTEQANPTGFNYDDKYATFVSAAKTVGHHAEDGAYNAATLQAYETAKADIAKDLDFWYPGMTPGDGGDYINFPSGKKVLFGQVDQYKLMLDFYQSKQELIDSAKASKTKPAGIIDKFEAVPLSDSGAVYLDGNGQKLAQLGNGWLYSNPSMTAVISNGEAEDLLAAKSGIAWKKWKEAPEAPKIVFKATLNTKTHDKASEFDQDTMELSKTGSAYQAGMTGSEYEVTLPTGEKIFFRNSGTTNTVLAQRGRLTIKVPNAKSEQDMAAGIERAQAWITDNLGIDLSPAEHADAELLYWKQMNDVLVHRKHTTGSAWYKAKADLDVKVKELGGNHAEFAENFAAAASTDEQNKFYRELWGKHFGKDKVAALVANEKYLPEFDKPNMNHIDLVQGRPNWYRFDVDLSEFAAAGHMLGSSAQSSDDVVSVAKTGAAFSTEERMRVLGMWKSGASSSADQIHGGSNSIFTRIYKDTKHSGISFIYHPKAMLRTDTVSYDYDAYGNQEARASKSPSNPLDGWINFVTNTTGSSGPETDLQNTAALFGDLEILIFDDAMQLNAAVQALKKKGITQIRGVAIEDRLVMRNKLTAAIQKLKATWYK